jgi:hypothetical protein
LLLGVYRRFHKEIIHWNRPSYQNRNTGIAHTRRYEATNREFDENDGKKDVENNNFFASPCSFLLTMTDVFRSFSICFVSCY